jgi:hypothetical protein
MWFTLGEMSNLGEEISKMFIMGLSFVLEKYRMKMT